MDHSSGFGCVMIDAVRPARQEYGALAQLGERLLCKQDVVGSIPSGSTTFLKQQREDQESKFGCLPLRACNVRIFRHRKEMAFCSV